MASDTLIYRGGRGRDCTFVKFRSDLALSREQRDRDLRWKQVEAGKTLTDELLRDPEAYAALQIIDFSGRTFEIPPKRNSEPITHDDVRASFNTSADASPTDKQLYVRDCFDKLFFHLARCEHHINSTLVVYDDVAFPLEYYVPRLAAFRPEVDEYSRPVGVRGRASATVAQCISVREEKSPDANTSDRAIGRGRGPGLARPSISRDADEVGESRPTECLS